MSWVQIVAASALCLIGISLCGAGDRLFKTDTNPLETEANLQPLAKMDDAKFKDWLLRWERNILGEIPQNYCSKEMGEDMGWVMSPMLGGFYQGYLATGDQKWLDLVVSCTDSWIKRAVVEPDGYVGWPKIGAAGTKTDHLDDFYADSMLGEAMVLRPVVLASGQVLETPPLEEKFGVKARGYLALAEQVFEKWDKRGAWRDTVGGGMITVELPFGIDRKTAAWTEGYQHKHEQSNGFSHQNNKANLIACWLVALFDVTHNPIYRERAERWFRLMNSRMQLRDDGTFEIWNYWEPAGDWDYHLSFSRLNILPKHWIGVHRNPGYYDIDVEAIVTAYQHGLVFDQDTIIHLIKTAIANQRYWTALVPYNNTIQKQFEDHNDPNSWAGLGATPWYLAWQARLFQTNAVH